MADVNLYNVNDGLVGRDGGPYLDQEEQRAAEERRAIIEDREPDLENPGATAGTVLVPAVTLVQNAASLNVPSRDNTAVLTDAANSLAESDAVSATVAATVPVEEPEEEEAPAEEEVVEEEAPAEEETEPEAPSSVFGNA
jgi:hypothetical protein